MNICMTINSKYVRYTYVTLLSLYENEKKGDIRLFIIHDDLTNEDKRILSELAEKYENTVEYIDCDMDLLNSMPVFRGEKKERYPISIFSRLLIPRYIPEDVDRLLLIDSDLIINKPVDALYHMDMKENYFAAAINMCGNAWIPLKHRKWYGENRHQWLHYNIGVLLWDLDKIRKELSDDYIFKLAWKWDKVQVDTFDEELLNVEFGEDKILRIPEEKWNYITPWSNRYGKPVFQTYASFEELKQNCAIIHYAGFAPWKGDYTDESYDLWWSYAKQTPFFDDFLDEVRPLIKKNIIEKYIERDNLNNLLNIMQNMILFDGKEKLLSYLSKNNISKILVYGAGRVGECISHLLDKSDYKIAAYVDQKKTGVFCGLPIIRPEQMKDYRNDVDLLLISNGYHLKAIKDQIERSEIKWTSVEDIL